MIDNLSYYMFPFRNVGFPGKESACNVGALGWEDPLEKEKATHSSILAWRIPWTIQSRVSQIVGHDWATFTFQERDRFPPLFRSCFMAFDNIVWFSSHCLDNISFLVGGRLVYSVVWVLLYKNVNQP